MKTTLDFILRYSAAVIMALSLSGTVHAGSDDLADWAKNEKKLYKKIVDYSHLTKQAVRELKSGGITPKRVGLVSLYLFDTSEVKYSAMAATYGGTSKSSFGLSTKGTNIYATELAEIAVPELKKAFADNNLELLTPVEYLLDDQTKETYMNFQLDQGGLTKAAMSALDWLQKNPQASAAAIGYNEILSHFSGDAKGLTSLEELRKSLGLDALVVLAHTSSSSKKGVWLTGVHLYMYGHNVIPKPKMKIAQISWSEGALYTQGQFAKGFKSAQIVKWKKGKNAVANYDGYDVIINALAKKSLDTFWEEYNKGK
ncbi:MAG: hypothetical protein HN729_03235 [Candidatus Marinimicrobia bacterium]|jgi:hypothetical protein|nr:hypothetical protein [Candidatus Neomarinimicrobiota bacterium]MBT3634536.1 hypothetical protein [Candidatus Neomarinimicrobiota bacterium]MBT3683433.1 hypothetical protein [Candidatus Neomarinimicrobiota bacterium]MBT3760321.1 hypothetical protein [Candidatus Neomarinimicrobiota bacterium]MBT3896416.1 hypothetical protein [Candidatus Neomarinimicrobiota bacterium]